MSEGQGSNEDGTKEDHVSLNALTAEELGAIVSNEKYRHLLAELLPQYEEELEAKSTKRGASEAELSSGNGEARRISADRDTSHGYEPSGEGTPAPPSRKRKRRASDGAITRNTQSEVSASTGSTSRAAIMPRHRSDERSLSSRGTDRPPTRKSVNKRGAEHSSRSKNDKNNRGG